MAMSRIRTSIALVALGVATVAGCSSGDGADSAATTTAAATTGADSAESGSGQAGTADAAGAPDEAALLTVVEGIGDPAVPTAEKVELVENGPDREAVIDQFNGVLTDYPLTFGVADVVLVDPATATAAVTVEGPHGGAPFPFTFVEQDGTWKLADASFCTLAAMGQVAC